MSYVRHIAILVASCCAVVASCTTNLSVKPTKAARTECRISKVVDGDTVDITCPGQPTQRARLMGYDTPEVFSPACSRELLLGRTATQRLRELVKNASISRIALFGTDRYGRRLVRVRLDRADLADTMVSEGLAVRYTGGRRINWCERLAA